MRGAVALPLAAALAGVVGPGGEVALEPQLREELRAEAGPPGRPFVVLVEGDEYLAHAAALAKALHDLGHREPLLLMVPRQGALAARAAAITEQMSRNGWNGRAVLFDPAPVDFDFANKNWKQDLQKVQVLDPRTWAEAGLPPALREAVAGGFVHLDADLLVLRSLASLATK